MSQKNHCFALSSLALWGLVLQGTQETVAGTWLAVRTQASFFPHTRGAPLAGQREDYLSVCDSACVCKGERITT